MLRITNGRNGGWVGYDEGGEIVATVESDEVISAATDSWSIAAQFGSFVAVDHDRDEIFAYTAEDQQLAKRDESPDMSN
jgi:hypothetical protein